MKYIFQVSISAIICALILLSCKKENSKHCWVIVDNSGNELSRVCNKTESELVECVNNKSCGVNIGFIINSCNYFIEDAPSYCYLINGRYQEAVNESSAELYRNCYGITVEKVACGYCKNWYTREKRTYKPTSQFFYSAVTVKQFCGDTLSTLYQGRQIIRKDDTDSLIAIQFSNNGVDW